MSFACPVDEGALCHVKNVMLSCFSDTVTSEKSIDLFDVHIHFIVLFKKYDIQRSLPERSNESTV